MANEASDKWRGGSSARSAGNPLDDPTGGPAAGLQRHKKISSTVAFLLLGAIIVVIVVKDIDPFTVFEFYGGLNLVLLLAMIAVTTWRSVRRRI